MDSEEKRKQYHKEYQRRPEVKARAAERMRQKRLAAKIRKETELLQAEGCTVTRGED